MQSIFSSIVLLAILFFIYVWLQFRSSMRVRIWNKSKIPTDFNLIYLNHKLSLGSNKKINVWYIPVKRPKAVVILMYGYATVSGGVSSMLNQAKFLNGASYSTVLIDPKSLLKNGENKIYLGTREWIYAEKIYDFVKSLPENKGKKVGFLGDSMGAVASILTVGLTDKGDFVIAVAPFSNYKSLFFQQIRNKGYPASLVPLVFLFLRLAAVIELRLNLNFYSPDNIVQKVKVPFFVISAHKDSWVGNNAGRVLFDKAKVSTKEFWKANTTHKVFEDNSKEYQRKVLSFLNRYL